MATTIFVHGNAVTTAQTPGGGAITSPGDLLQVNGIPWTDVVGLRQGWGSTFRGKGGKFVWFHIPVPTPTVIQGVQSHCAGIDIFFDVDQGAVVDSVHFWGSTNNRWYAEDNLGLHSSFHRQWNPAGALNGVLGISVGVRFSQDANITFRGVQMSLT